MTNDEQYVPSEKAVRRTYTYYYGPAIIRRSTTEQEFDRFLARVRRDAARDAVEDADYWQARAYEAEGKLWRAEARIKAVQHLIDQADEMGEWAITCTRLQWAIDGSNPQPSA